MGLLFIREGLLIVSDHTCSVGTPWSFVGVLVWFYFCLSLVYSGQLRACRYGNCGMTGVVDHVVGFFLVSCEHFPDLLAGSRSCKFRRRNFFYVVSFGDETLFKL